MPDKTTTSAKNPSRSRTWLPILVLVLLTTIVFGKVFLHPTQMIWSSDIVRAHCEYKFVQWNSLFNWHVFPVWDPTPYCGKSITGDPLFGLLYPPSWIFWLIPNLSMFGFFLWFQFALGCIGMYLFAKRKGCNTVGALVAAVTFALSGKFASHTFGGHVELISTTLGLPWMLWATEGILQNPTWKRAALLAIVSTLAATCGSVQMLYWNFLLLFAYVIISLFQTPTPNSPTPFSVSRFTFHIPHFLYLALAGALFLLLAAPWWFPIVRQTSMLGARMTETTYEFATMMSPRWPDLFKLVWPYLGNPLPTLFMPDGFHRFQWEYSSYPGVIALCLALAAPLVVRNKRLAISLMLFSIFIIVLAMGKNSPLYWLAWKFIPGFGLFRCSGRMFFYSGLLIGLLAGLTVTDLPQVRKKWLVPTLVSVVLGLVLIGSIHWANSPIAAQSGYLWLPVLALVPFLAAVCLWALGRLSNFRTSIIVLALLVIELTVFWQTNILMADKQSALPPVPAAEFLAQKHQTEEFRLYDPTRNIHPHAAAQYGLELITGYHPAIYKRHLDLYRAIWKEDNSDIVEQTMHSQAQVGAPVILDLMNVKYFITHERPKSQNYTEVFQFQDGDKPCFVYERKSVLPRAFITSRADLAPDGKTVLEAIPTLKPKEYCLVEDTPVAGMAPYQPLAIQRSAPSDLTMAFTLAEPGVAVISEAWHPDWVATDNDQPVPVRRVNHNFLGVPLPPGTHHLRVYYRPWDFYLGLALAGATALALLIACIIQGSKHPQSHTR